jgi:hypothetical protein
MFKIIKYILIFLSLLNSQFLHSQATFYRRDEKKEKAIIVTVTGFIFTSAAILDNVNKGRWANTTNGRQYIYPNIITSFPQNIMLGAGVSLTIGGLASFKRKY